MKQAYRNRYNLIDRQVAKFIFVKNEERSLTFANMIFFLSNKPFHKVPGAIALAYNIHMKSNLCI